MIVLVGLAFALTLGANDVLRSNLKAQESDQAAVRNTLLETVAAFERNDLPALSQVWAKDESLTVFENGHANYGWTDYRDNHLVPEMAAFADEGPFPTYDHTRNLEIQCGPPMA